MANNLLAQKNGGSSAALRAGRDSADVSIELLLFGNLQR